MLEVKCNTCGKNVHRNKSDIAKSKTGFSYCSKSCAASKNNTLRRKEKNPNWNGETSTYRESAINHFGAVCKQCGYKKHKEVLQVHHKDHNRKNNKLDNLEVLCANCHITEHIND